MPTSDSATEYYVFEDERQIISLGWKYAYDQATNYNNNALHVAIWILRNGVYEISKEFDTTAPHELQGMCYQNGYIYYLDNTTTYKHKSINRINLGSGITEIGYTPIAGLIIQEETESIEPLNSELFSVVARNGRSYICAF